MNNNDNADLTLTENDEKTSDSLNSDTGSSKPRKPKRLGLSSGYFTEPFDDNQAAAYKEAGVSFIEFSQQEKRFEISLAEKHEDFVSAVGFANKHGLRFQTYHIPYGDNWDISVLDEDKRQWNVKHILELATTINSIQAPEIGFILHPSFEPIPETERVGRLNQARKSLIELASSLELVNPEISWAVENLPRTCLGRDIAEMKYLLESDFRLGFCFDTNHLLTEDNLDLLDELGHRMICIHIADYDKTNERHWAPGSGIIDWDALKNKLDEINFENSLLYEVGNFSVGVDRTEFTLDDLRNNYFEVLKGE